MPWVLAVGLIVLGACDAPWAGPVLPDGTHQVDLTMVAEGPPGQPPDIVASTSLEVVRQTVIAREIGFACASPRNYPDADPCWQRLPGRNDRIYLAVVTTNECAAAIKEEAWVGGRTLHFIHWVGNPSCPPGAGALASPSWRLFSVSRSDLPPSGTLVALLELQGSESGSVRSQVI